MAAVKEIEKAIKAHQYVSDSIAYILSPENRNGDEKCFSSTCLNCANESIEGLVQQFYVVRRAFRKDDNILAHHYVQSFSPNEKITPELAHKIGVELAESVAPGFQVIVATHIDKDHIHNVHYAIVRLNIDGTATFDKPVPMPGAVSLSLDPNGEPNNFYADGFAYYTISNNMGYEGDLELALIPESFRRDVLKETIDSNGVLIENSNVETENFQKLFSLSPSQESYLKTGKKGSGLIVCGRKIIPFEKPIPTDSLMYKICTTKFGEN